MEAILGGRKISERPRGLRLVSTIQTIGAIVCAAIALIAFYLAAYLTSRLPSLSPYDQIVTGRGIQMFSIFGAVLFVIGVVGSVGAYWLWKLKRWGFFASISVNGLMILIALLIGDFAFSEWFIGSPLRPYIWVVIASVLWIPILFLVYLFLVREHFIQ